MQPFRAGVSWRCVPDYDRGVLDGFEIAVRLFHRHFDRPMRDLADARKAKGNYRVDARGALETLRVHQLRHCALFFGLDNATVPERVEILRMMLPTEEEDGPLGAAMP